jgi:hypothetical protein
MQQQQCWLWRVWFVVPLQLAEPETSPHWRNSNTATRVHLYRLLHQMGTLPISTQFTKTRFSIFREYDRTEECSPHGTHVTPRPHHLCSRNYHTTGTTTRLCIKSANCKSLEVWQINARSKHLQMATAFSTQRLLPRSETSPRLQNFVYLHALRCLNIQTTIKDIIRLQGCILSLKTTTKQLSIVPLTVTSRVPGQFMLCLLS